MGVIKATTPKAVGGTTTKSAAKAATSSCSFRKLRHLVTTSQVIQHHHLSSSALPSHENYNPIMILTSKNVYTLLSILTRKPMLLIGTLFHWKVPLPQRLSHTI